jgi:hypothetical protein
MLGGGRKTTLLRDITLRSSPTSTIEVTPAGWPSCARS